MFEDLGAQLDGWLHSVKLRRLRLMRRLGLLPKPTPEQIRAAEQWNQALERIALFAPYLDPLDSPVLSAAYLDPLDFPDNLPTDLEVEQALETRGKEVTVRKWADLKCTVNGELLESVETLNWRLPPHG
jgi:hypothetical protein